LSFVWLSWFHIEGSHQCHVKLRALDSFTNKEKDGAGRRGEQGRTFHPEGGGGGGGGVAPPPPAAEERTLAPRANRPTHADGYC